MSVVAISQVLLAGALWLCWLRVGRVRREVIDTTAVVGADSWTRLFRDELLGRVDGWGLPGVGADGLGGIEVRHRESHDAHRNVLELIAALVRASNCRDRAGVERWVKGVYQLQASLGLDQRTVDRLLAEPIQRLGDVVFTGREPGTAEQVVPGVLTDHRSMFAVTAGCRVEQPLGVVLRDSAGRVIARAKVACRD